MIKEKFKSFLWNENIISLALICLSFSVYLITMYRSVAFTDTGELAAVVCTLGIAHPTGYPLLTLLGRCWIMLPTQMEEIIRLNIFSALLTAVTVGIFFKTSLLIYRSTLLFQFKNINRKAISDHSIIFASIIASVSLAFSTTFWSQSNAFEVYSLHLILILLTTNFFIRGLEEQLAEPDIISRKLFLFAFILGLSFSNHMTTILLAPGFLWLFFRIIKWGRKSFKLILKLAPFFLLGFSIYMYLPIRSAGRPLFDWGHPASFERLFWHVSGKQFRVWMFSGWDVVQKQLTYYFNDFLSEYNFIALPLILLGIGVMFKQTRRLLFFLLILFGTNILYSINYDIFDIGSYFLLSYIISGWMIFYGTVFAFGWLKDKSSLVKMIVIIVIVTVPIFQIINNWENCDASTNKLPQKFTSEAFSKIDSNAVVLASQWDFFISPSYYYQFIKNQRRDITIIDKSLMQNRSWYFLQLEHQAPWLMKRIRPSVDLFLIELNKFERETPFDFNVIQMRWQNLLNEIVENSLPDHPVYLDLRIDGEFSPKFQRIPAGLFLRLSEIKDSSYYRTANTQFELKNKNQPVIANLESYYVSMLLYEANWLIQRRRIIEAKAALNEITRFEPTNYHAKRLMANINSQ